MMYKLSEAGSLDLSPQNKTLYFNFAASVSGIIFAVVLWIVRPLNCAGGTSTVLAVLIDFVSIAYAVSCVLMVVNVVLIWHAVAAATRRTAKTEIGLASRARARRAHATQRYASSDAARHAPDRSGTPQEVENTQGNRKVSKERASCSLVRFEAAEQHRNVRPIHVQPF